MPAPETPDPWDLSLLLIHELRDLGTPPSSPYPDAAANVYLDERTGPRTQEIGAILSQIAQVADADGSLLKVRIITSIGETVSPDAAVNLGYAWRIFRRPGEPA